MDEKEGEVLSVLGLPGWGERRSVKAIWDGFSRKEKRRFTEAAEHKGMTPMEYLRWLMDWSVKSMTPSPAVREEIEALLSLEGDDETTEG